MKNITLRQFVRKPSLYIAQLPLKLTRYGKVIASITQSVDTNTKYVDKLPRVVNSKASLSTQDTSVPTLTVDTPQTTSTHKLHYNAMLNTYVE